MQDLRVPHGRGPTPLETPNDKGEWLRTAGSPTDEDHGPVLHLGNTEHTWGQGQTEESREQEREGGERRVQWHKHGHSIYDNPLYLYSPMCI